MFVDSSSEPLKNCRKESIHSRSFSSDTFQENPSEMSEKVK